MEKKYPNHQIKIMFNGIGYIDAKVKALETALLQSDEIWEHFENKIPITYKDLHLSVKRAPSQYTITCEEEQPNGA